jgi:pimeloyl-ACP methyl ester carboxylesterase
VIGHSYGSTTTAHAAADGLDADSLVLIGSPGAGGGVHDASGLNMPEGQVFVGSASHDPVTWLGGEIPIQVPGGLGLDPIHLGNLGLGDDPSQGDFGAINFEVDDGQSFHGAGGLVNTGLMQNHTSYFDQGNPALDNMAHVVSGHGDEVIDTGGRDQDAHDYLYDWAGGEVQHGVQQAYEQHVQPVVDTVTDTAVGTYETVTHGAGAAWDTAQDGFDAVWPDHWP